MSRIAEDVWKRLAGARIKGQTLWARRAAPDVTDRLLAALDAGGQRHLLVYLRPEEKGLHDSHSRGLSVNTRELEVPAHDIGRYMDIVCQDATGHEAFDLVGGELAQRLQTGRESATDCVTHVLAKWRRFWGQLPRAILSREKQLGLIGELWFLSLWLIPRVGPSEAIVRWRGPFNGRHDFEWVGRSIEVKTTTSTRGKIHRIHGIEQLAPPERGELLFYSLRLREEAGASNTLPSLVAICRKQLEGLEEAQSRLESGLAQYGYSSAHDEEYEKQKFRVVEEGLFAVRDEFPRLTPAMITGGVPGGVEYVEYEIDLSGFEHLRVAQRSSDAFTI
ncbi:MAG: PD-(D/E)XK motif protein [Nitrospirae bacterium]|nr:PD-(D/E)XK motif protein [Nitrospirota bacterium]